MPKVSASKLADLFNRYADIIFQYKGNIRGIENHGLRNMPTRLRRKNTASDGSRFYWEARYVTVTFDASPVCLLEADRFLRLEEPVLRQFVTRAKTNLELAASETYKNPFKNVATK
eukprot:CAMPEP_0202972028 /NCGR_PEP_ID=MMETSP1396-20130829/32787_1 /ASSEMBLY_ACC=CAM_ASM_000872 /TAXON_ID= /ORGANISM="Pseudokeronopsis sp., Strain Brazil" /LENGTH=115 /DNA_ID=CAMNT_0049702021 /DNA_START=25 /DNA_END=372 /DNA_ORIENTATION=+